MTVRRFDSIRAAESVIRAVEGRGTASQTYVVLRAVERAFWRCAWARLNSVALIRACVSEGFRVYVARHNLRKGLRWASEKGIRFDFYSSCGYGSSIDLKTLTESRRIYRRRQAERYGHRGPIAALYFAALNYISLSIPGDRGYLAVLRIGGRIAATMEGYVNRSRRALEMPRLSMDSSFSEYGPGRLLVAECVRWMLAETDLRILDLCRGDERYKRELGGRRYLTRCVALELGGGV